MRLHQQFIRCSYGPNQDVLKEAVARVDGDEYSRAPLQEAFEEGLIIHYDNPGHLFEIGMQYRDVLDEKCRIQEPDCIHRY